MRIDHIHISGFKNLLNANLRFPKTITALIGFNNYGKSNFISAIEFVFEFIKSTPEQRAELFKRPYIRPLITTLHDTPFTCDIAFSDPSSKYDYHMQWIWTDDAPCVMSEILKKDNVTIFQRLGNSVINSAASKIEPLALEIDTLEDDAARYLRQLGVFTLSDHAPANLGNTLEASLGTALHKLKEQYPGDFELLCDAFLGLLPDIKRMELRQNEDQWRICYYQQHIEQNLPFEFLSTGSQRLFQLLFSAIQGRRNNLDLLVFEEVENSIHPRLIPLLLMALTELAGKCQIILTSHSPYLIQHLPLGSITIALPTQQGASGFRRIDPKMWDELNKQAQELDVSLGVFLFDLLIESHYQPNELMRWLQ